MELGFPRKEVNDMYITTVRQLENLPFGFYILSFAELHSKTNRRWGFKFMVQDMKDENLYHVEFDLPLSPQKRLTFDFFMKNGEPCFSKVIEI